MKPGGRCNDLNAITLLSWHAFGCDINAKFAIALKRSGRFSPLRIKPATFPAYPKCCHLDTIKPVPSDKTSLRPKAVDFFFSKHLENKPVTRPINHIEPWHTSCFQVAHRIFNPACCPQLTRCGSAEVNSQSKPCHRKNEKYRPRPKTKETSSPAPKNHV